MINAAEAIGISNLGSVNSASNAGQNESPREIASQMLSLRNNISSLERHLVKLQDQLSPVLSGIAVTNVASQESAVPNPPQSPMAVAIHELNDQIMQLIRGAALLSRRIEL